MSTSTEARLQVAHTEADRVDDALIAAFPRDARGPQSRVPPAEALAILTDLRRRVLDIASDVAAWNVRENTASREAELSGMLRQRLGNQLAAIDALQVANWGERTAEAKANLAAMKREALEETNRLQAENGNDELKFAVLSPVKLSRPGDRAQGSGTAAMSAAALRAELETLVTEQEAAEVSCMAISEALGLPTDESPAFDDAGGPPVDTRDVTQRRADFDQARLATQREYRPHEDRNLENLESAAQQRRLPRHLSSASNAATVDTAARIKFLLELDREWSHEMRSQRGIDESSRRLQEAFNRELDSRNAQERFCGYTRMIQKQVAMLGVTCAMQFVLIPPFSYELGYRLGLDESTLLAMQGSEGPSARLDRRTQLWLLSKSSQMTHGTAYRDGPMHFGYHSNPRRADVMPFYLSARPVTRSQFAALQHSQRFREALATLWQPAVPGTSYVPTILKGELARVIELPPLHVEDKGADEPLEVSYFVAEAIAEAVGAVVCPADVWEAAVRGAEGYHFVMTAERSEDAAVHPQSLTFESVPWTVKIDGGQRFVSGSSSRISADTEARLRALTSPFGLRDAGRCGFEWNSAVDVRGGTTSDRDGSSVASLVPSNADFVPSTHVVRSMSDVDSQIVLENEQAPSSEGGRVDPTNRRRFVGPTADVFVLPHRGVSVAAFRLAFPATRECHEIVAERRQRMRAANGMDLTFSDLVCGFGVPLSHAGDRWNSDLQLRHLETDPLYGSLTCLFPASGFDVAFRGEVPHELYRIVLHSIPRPAPVQLLERRSYQHANAGLDLDRCGRLVALPIVGRQAIESVKEHVRRAGCVVVTDIATSFEFKDSVTVPHRSQDGPIPPTVHQVNVNLTIGKFRGDTVEARQQFGCDFTDEDGSGGVHAVTSVAVELQLASEGTKRAL